MLHPLLLVPDPWPVPKALHTHSMNGSVGLIFKAWLFPFQLHRGFLIFSWKVWNNQGLKEKRLPLIKKLEEKRLAFSNSQPEQEGGLTVMIGTKTSPEEAQFQSKLKLSSVQARNRLNHQSMDHATVKMPQIRLARGGATFTVKTRYNSLNIGRSLSR